MSSMNFRRTKMMRMGNSMAIVTVTGPDGKPYQVDTKYLQSAQEPQEENYIGWTTDGQMYQRVGGQWYRLLRTDKVDFVSGILPKAKTGASFDFTVGREVSYIPPVVP